MTRESPPGEQKALMRFLAIRNDCLRRQSARRMELRLLDKQVADELGTSEITVKIQGGTGHAKDGTSHGGIKTNQQKG